MDELNIFEEATRLGLTFEHKGTLNVEDLWNLNLSELNSIYKSLSKLSKQNDEEGLLDNRATKADKELELKVKVVKRVFEVLQEEEIEKKSAAQKRAKREKLKEILERKQNQELENKPPEEIEALIEELS